MDYKYLKLIPLLSAISLAGCELTDEDKEKLDKAGENLEKVALKPSIASPGDDAVLSTPTTIKINVDTTVPHKSVTLFIDGEEIATDEEAPFQFSWDPYFWSKDNQESASVSTILVTALTEGGAFARSDVRNVYLSESLNESIEFTAPNANQSFKNTSEINLTWTARIGAVNYEYQLNDELIVTTTGTNATLNLENTGNYQLKIRATNDLGYTGAWGPVHSFSIDIPDTLVLNPVTIQPDNGWQSNFSWSGSLTSSELQIATDQNFNFVVETLNTTAQRISKVLPDGNYFARLRTHNEFGHKSLWSPVQPFNINNTVQILTPSANQSFQNTNEISISWNTSVGAVNYEYQLDNNPVASISNTNTTLTLNSIGIYQIKIRAINDLGFEGPWSALRSFNIVTPSAPILSNPTATKTQNGWQATFNWTGSLTSSELQIATDQDFNSLVETLSTEDETLNEVLAPGVYYARIRTMNEFDHMSEWSTRQVIEVGLFAHKIDLSTSGIITSDSPKGFILSDDSITILSSYSDLGDNSGDSITVTKLDFDGSIQSNKSYRNYLSSSLTISKKTDGFLILGRSKDSWRDHSILAIDDFGNKVWQTVLQGTYDAENSTLIDEDINDVIEISNNIYAYLRETTLYNITGNYPNNYQLQMVNHALKIDILDRSRGSNIVTSAIVNNPESGIYNSLDKLLINESGLFATGSYTATIDSGSDNSDDGFSTTDNGAFLLDIDESNGLIISQHTGGGINNTQITNLIELSNGELTVSYNHYNIGATTTFANNADSSISKLDNTIRYPQIASEPSGGYFMVGSSWSNNKKSIISHYNSENQLIGSSHTFNSCFYNLDITSLEYHPDYGLIALGTDEYSSSYNTRYTVIFNITDNFDYLCPTAKE